MIATSCGRRKSNGTVIKSATVMQNTATKTGYEVLRVQANLLAKTELSAFIIEIR